MQTRSQALTARKNILDLPPEIFSILEAYLEIRELATFVLTCKSIRQHVERFLYKVVFISRRGPNAPPRSLHNSTSSFVSLLKSRPEIVPWIHKFVISEYDAEHFPQLLSFTFPNLENLILNHDGSVKSPTLSTRKLNSLYAAIQPQTALQNLTVNIEQKLGTGVKDYEIYSLPASGSTIFRHPRLTRLRLSYIDLTAFNRLPEDYFLHSNLGELFLERCSYSTKNLKQLMHPCQNLQKLWLYQEQHLPFPENELPSILHPVKDTLRVLKTVWGHLHPLTEEGMDFRAFPNLHEIIIHPELLFGRSYISASKSHLSDLIKSHLPPNLLILALEGIVPVHPPEPALMVPHPNTPNGLQFADQPIPAYDLALMRHVLMHMEDVAPKLEWLVCFYLEHMENIPKDVIDLAKKKDVRCCELYEHDEIAPPIDMSLHLRGREWEGFGDSKGFCTHLNHQK